jgi:hypothetical protein
VPADQIVEDPPGGVFTRGHVLLHLQRQQLQSLANRGILVVRGDSPSTTDRERAARSPDCHGRAGRPGRAHLAAR